MSDSTSPTSSATSQSSSTPQAQNGPSGTASSLYLYTFLATLVLLLGVSAAIVLRSMALRVRHRRMIEEAIRNGTYIPPSQRPNIQAADKPMIYDVYIDEGGDVEKWDKVLPVSAAVIPTSKPSDSKAPAGTTGTSPPTTPPRAGLIRTLGREFRTYYFPRRQSDLPQNDVDLEAGAQFNQERQLTPLKEGGEVGVTVLIAMPSQNHPGHRHDHDGHRHATSSSSSSSDEKKDANSFGFGYCSADQGLPHLEFGLAKLPVIPLFTANADETTSDGLGRNSV